MKKVGEMSFSELVEELATRTASCPQHGAGPGWDTNRMIQLRREIDTRASRWDRAFDRS